MKLAVFDNVNKARLLGHLMVSPHLLRGYRLEVPVLEQADLRELYFRDTHPKLSPMRTIMFDIEVRSESNKRRIDAITDETVTITRKVLETSASLETLLQMDNFRLPDESDYEARERQRYQRVYR